MATVPDHMKLTDVAGSSSLIFARGSLPADVAVFAAGHEPNGYFWTGVAEYLAGGWAQFMIVGQRVVSGG
jgi:hypothetical protein